MNEIIYSTRETLEKFSEEFIKEHYPNDAMFHQVIELLKRGGDKYSIIEILLKDRKKILDMNSELLKISPRSIMIVK